MFRLRLTAGRATAPLGRPQFASARGIQIPQPEIFNLSDGPRLALQADQPASLVYQAPSAPGTDRLGLQPLEMPAVVRLAALLQPADESCAVFEGLVPETITGGVITLAVPAHLGGAPALPHAAKPFGARESLASETEQMEVAWFHPFLEPAPSLDPSSVFLGFPRALRPYQIEAVQGLLSHDGYLLADDPGTGKTVTSCVALQELLQSHQVRRTLVICLEGGVRHWAFHLAAWVPGVLVTAVHGDPQARVQDWQSPAHVYLVEYDVLAEDVEAGRLTRGAEEFDLIILDDVHALQRRAGQPHPVLDRLMARRRWALAGALPREAGEWLTVFGFLTPDRGLRGSDITLPNLQRRFLPDTLRRTKADLASQLPRLTRDEVWVDLDPRQRQVYDAILSEERKRLAALGGAATRSHIQAAIDRLQQASNFVVGSLDGCKVRPLLSMVEDVASAGAKVVVISQFRGEGLDKLRQVLEAYGTAIADSEAPEADRNRALDDFRTDARLHVLLADDRLRPPGGPLEEATYVVHFDHAWNPAIVRRMELRLHPDPGTAAPVNVTELWVAETIDERLHQLLAERSLLPADLPLDVRAALLEDRITATDLMERVLEVPSTVPAGPGPIVVVPGQRPPPTPQTEREALQSLTPERLLAGAAQLMLALGFEGSEIVRGPEEAGGELIARRGSRGQVEQVLVRCLHSAKDVGVGEARALLAELEARPGLVAAYLISTADFTSSCKRLADESGGRLSLVSGAEFYRHLHILGAI